MRPRLLSPSSVLSGVFTFGLLLLQAAVARAVVPHLIELLRTAPRLAMLGFFGLVTLPGSVAFVAHRTGSRFLDQYSSVAGKGGLAESAWAGALAWLVLYGSTIVTRLLVLVIHPPRPEPDAFALSDEVMAMLAEATPSNVLSLWVGLYIFVAAVFYEIEQRARGKR